MKLNKGRIEDFLYSILVREPKNGNWMKRVAKKLVNVLEGEFEDAERLNELQKATTGYGKGWILRKSKKGRGIRLHETVNTDAKSNVREAIDDYFKTE